MERVHPVVMVGLIIGVLAGVVGVVLGEWGLIIVGVVDLLTGIVYVLSVRRRSLQK